MRVAFAATHIFAEKNINVVENILAPTVNEFVINEFVKLTMLRTNGPRFSLSAYRIVEFCTIWYMSVEI